MPPYDSSYGASHLELENEKEQSLRVGNLISFEVDSKSENKEVVNEVLAEVLPRVFMLQFLSL